jgi:hypothetical protein
MNWTKILADAGIPEPPDREQAYRMLLFLRQPDTSAMVTSEPKAATPAR